MIKNLFNENKFGTTIESIFLDVQIAIYVRKLEDKKYFNSLIQLKIANRFLRLIGALCERIECFRNKALSDEYHLQSQWNRYMSLEVHTFHAITRSLLDHVSYALSLSHPNHGKIQEGKSFRKFMDWVLKNPTRIENDFTDIFKNADWFRSFRGIRDLVIHFGGGVMIFGDVSEGILFQVYDDNLDEKVFVEEKLKYNSNIIFLDRYIAFIIVNLLSTVKELSLAMSKILNPQNLRPSDTEIELQKQNMINYDPGFGILQKWIEEYQNQE